MYIKLMVVSVCLCLNLPIWLKACAPIPPQMKLGERGDQKCSGQLKKKPEGTLMATQLANERPP